MGSHPTIAVAGAGSVGCYVGGCLAAADRGVTLLGRPDLMQAIGRHGLRLGDQDGRDTHLAPGTLAGTSDPAAALAGTTLILVTTKSLATAEMADLIAAHAPSDAVVVSLQNGVSNVPLLRAKLGADARIVAGMVPFNLVQSRDPDGTPRIHRATAGRVHVAAGLPEIVTALDVPGLPTIPHPDMNAVAWGKLVLNLNNALNALAGIPLRDELADRRWRLILAAQAREAIAALAASGMRPARIDGIDPRLVPFVLRLPDLLFRLAARAMLAIDPSARSSMWDDLERRRPTEIEHLQGAVLGLAAKAGTPAPVTARIRDLIRAAEAAGRGSPRLAPGDVAGDLVRLG